MERGSKFDDRLLKRLIECRDALLFDLTEQQPPPEIYAARLREALGLVVEVAEEIKQTAGVEEPLGHAGWTIYSDNADLGPSQVSVFHPLQTSEASC